MFGKFVELLLDYLKQKPYWPLLQPVVTLVSLYVVACIVAYQYIEWRYHFTPELTTFLGSYLVKQISVVFATIAVLALVLGVRWKQSVGTEATARVKTWVRVGAWNLVVAGVVVAISIAMFLRLVPHRVSHITVQFLEEPKSFDEGALAYIVYELNRFQTDWHFTLDGDVFNPASASSADQQACREDVHCYVLRTPLQPWLRWMITLCTTSE